MPVAKRDKRDAFKSSTHTMQTRAPCMQRYQSTTQLNTKTHILHPQSTSLAQPVKRPDQPAASASVLPQCTPSRLPPSPTTTAHSPDPDQYVPARHTLHAEAPASVVFIMYLTYVVFLTHSQAHRTRRPSTHQARYLSCIKSNPRNISSPCRSTDRHHKLTGVNLKQRSSQ